MAISALVLGVLAIFIGTPNDVHKIYVNAKEMALSTVKDQDKISVKTFADWLIKDKADFILVDLRNEKDFYEYNIPSSVNKKMENLLGSDLMRNQKVLLYGNDNIAAAQAWFILKSSNYKAVYILNGGMDAWKNEILFPKLSAAATPEEIREFEKVKQVSIYFGGTPQIVSDGSATALALQQNKMPELPKLTAPAGNITPKAKKKKEGC